MRGRFAVIGTVAVLLAGCLGGGSGTGEPSDLPAPTATKTEDTGGIQGRVVTDEIQPIAGAQVVLHQTNQSTTTASDGGFAFSNLLPGDYNVIAVRLGYHQGAKRVTVLAGEIIEVQVMLDAVPITGDQFNETMKFATELLVNDLCEGTSDPPDPLKGVTWDEFMLPINATKDGKAIKTAGLSIILKSSPNSATVDVDMHLYNPAGTEIASGTSPGPNEMIEYTKKMAPGNYRLHVCLWAGAQAEITITAIVTYEEDTA